MAPAPVWNRTTRRASDPYIATPSSPPPHLARRPLSAPTRISYNTATVMITPVRQNTYNSSEHSPLPPSPPSIRSRNNYMSALRTWALHAWPDAFDYAMNGIDGSKLQDVLGDSPVVPEEEGEDRNRTSLLDMMKDFREQCRQDEEGQPGGRQRRGIDMPVQAERTEGSVLGPTPLPMASSQRSGSPSPSLTTTMASATMIETTPEDKEKGSFKTLTLPIGREEEEKKAIEGVMDRRQLTNSPGRFDSLGKSGKKKDKSKSKSLGAVAGSIRAMMGMKKRWSK